MCLEMGCTGSTRGSRSRYCRYHRQRQRRHGEPQQATIRAIDLVPYRKHVQGALSRDPERTVETVLEEIWGILVGNAQSEINELLAGRPGNRWHRRACAEFIKLGSGADFGVILETGLAMYLMEEHEPRRFASFTGFKFQLVRRIRAATNINTGEGYDPSTGKTKRYYRELPPKVILVMANHLVTILARAAGRIIHSDRKERERQRGQREALDKALDKLDG